MRCPAEPLAHALLRSLPSRVRRPTDSSLTLMTLVVAMQGAFANSRFCYLSLARLVARVEHGEGVVSTSGTIRARAARAVDAQAHRRARVGRAGDRARVRGVWRVREWRVAAWRGAWSMRRACCVRQRAERSALAAARVFACACVASGAVVRGWWPTWTEAGRAQRAKRRAERAAVAAQRRKRAERAAPQGRAGGARSAPRGGALAGFGGGALENKAGVWGRQPPASSQSLL